MKKFPGNFLAIGCRFLYKRTRAGNAPDPTTTGPPLREMEITR